MFNLIKFIYHFLPIKPVEKVKFVHYRKNNKIRAMLWKPKGNGPFPLAVLDVGLQFRIWEIPAFPNTIARTGYAALGTAYSRIEVAKSEVEDIISAIDHAYRHFTFLERKTVLVGVSMGAAAMLKVAAQVGEKYNIVAVIAMAPYADLTRAYYYAQGYINSKTHRDPRVKLLKLYKQYAYARPAEEPKEYYLRSPINFVKGIKCPVLFLHGKDDEIVTYDHSLELYHKMVYLKKNVELKLLPGEGVHTPLNFNSMLKKLNFIGFVHNWIYVHSYLRELL